ncbi:MAG: hypothetical protein CMK59_06870, partial [Proteobacteria bacterium]|nr:hypothetical protein [Pseudomonadota bacterium]
GVDSIKRVEILSELQDRAPQLPEVDGATMASLQTLAQIVSHMKEKSGNFFQAEASSSDVSAPVFQLKARESKASRIVHCDVPFQKLDLTVLGDTELVLAVSKLLNEQGIRTSTKITDTSNGLLDLRPLLPLSSSDHATKINVQVFEAARSIASRASLFAVVQDLGGELGLCGETQPFAALAAGVGGIVKTASLEWPEASCKLIDLDRRGLCVKEQAQVIVNELIWGGPDLEVGLKPKDNKRFVFELEPVVLNKEADVDLDENDVILVSGGARGVTAECVVALARATKSSFLLVGRSSIVEDIDPDAQDISALNRAILKQAPGLKLPEVRQRAKKILASREISSTLERLSRLGVKGHYLCANVTDEEALRRAIAPYRKSLGNITAVIHGAGVLADKKIADKSTSDFQWVYDVKIKGFQSLLSVTKQDPLKALVLFSSVAARSGNLGQSDYAAANEVLNKMAHVEASKRTGCRVHALGWGPWEGGMVTPELKRHFESMGVPLIGLKDGSDAMVDVLRSSLSAELIVGSAEAIAQNTVFPKLRTLLTREQFPFLNDHKIAGAYVVPMAQVILWIRSAAQKWGIVVSSIQNLKVLKPLRFEQKDFDDSDLSKRQLLFQLKEVSEDLWTFELSNQTGQIFYTAQILGGSEQVLMDNFKPIVAGEKLKNGMVYQKNSLFHGAGLQVLDSVSGLSLEGAEAEIIHRTELSDLDAALQLALLWTEQQLGKESVPMSIAEIRFGTEAPGVKCQLKGRSQKTRKAISDAMLLDKDGVVVAQLLGIETYTLLRT